MAIYKLDILAKEKKENLPHWLDPSQKQDKDSEAKKQIREKHRARWLAQQKEAKTVREWVARGHFIQDPATGLFMGSEPGSGEGGGEGSGGSGSSFRTTKADAFIKARDKSTRVNYLSPLKPEDLSQHKLFMNKEGTVGVAVSPSGDIQNVFNNGGPKGAGTEAVKLAIANGGKTLDCFAGFLPQYYAKLGFEEVERVKFDPQYAPANWDYEVAGTPDVVFMRLKS